MVKDGPAEEAGLKVGDVIVEFDGKPVNESAELPMIVARTPVEKKSRMKIIRDKKEIALRSLSASSRTRKSSPRAGERRVRHDRAEADPATSRRPRHRKTKGVVVAGVEAGSAGDEAGLQRGDVVLEVNRKAVAT